MVQIIDSERATLAFSFLLIGFVLYYVATSVASYRKLRHIPGPRLAAWSQLWLFNVTAGGDLYSTAEKVLRRYGA